MQVTPWKVNMYVANPDPPSQHSCLTSFLFLVAAGGGTGMLENWPGSGCHCAEWSLCSMSRTCSVRWWSSPYMLSGQTRILHSLPDQWGAAGTASSDGHWFQGAGGCLTGVGTIGGITGCESGDKGCDGEGESSKWGMGTSTGGSIGMSAGTHVDLFGLSHWGNCASLNEACAAVKQTLFRKHMKR